MSNKKSLGLVPVFLGFLLLALTGIRTISSPGIFTHIALGRTGSADADPLSYTMTGQPWIDMTPLYNSLANLLWSFGGAPLVTLTHVLVVLAAFILMFRFAKEWGGWLSQALALLLCARLILPVFNPEPGAFFMLFTALFLTILYRVKHFNLMAGSLLILQVLWTNMHPSFLFGPALILFFAVENFQSTRQASRATLITPLTTRLFGLSAMALAATMINPNLINLHRHVLANWVLLTGTEELEWISLFSSSFPQAFINKLTVFTLILGAGGLITLQKRLPAMLTLLALVGAFLTVRSIGSLGLFAFLAFPFMVLSFKAISEYLVRTLTTVSKLSEGMLQKLIAAATLLMIVASIVSLITNRAYINIGSASEFGLGVEKSAFPVAAAGVLSRDDFPKNILNIAHDGGYIALQHPAHKVFCDTRTSFYGLSHYQTLNRALLGQPEAWKSVLSKWNPHAVVLNACWPDSGALTYRLITERNKENQPVWKLVYFDGATVILVRNLPEYAALIQDPNVQKNGLTQLENDRQKYLEQSRGFIKAGNPSSLIGAGSIYLSLNRLTEAEALHTLLAQNSPAMAGAWLNLGQVCVLKRQIPEGLGYMEKAAQITPRNGRIWLSLFQTYRMTGDERKARDAADRLNKFYSADKATVEQQAVKEQKKPVEKPEQNGPNIQMPSELK